MTELEKIIGPIGDFVITYEDENYDFKGVLKYDNNNVILQCSFNIKVIRLIKENKEIDILGSIDGIDVTLFRGMLTNYSIKYGSGESANSIITPASIMIGKKFDDSFEFKYIRAECKQLNWLLEDPLEFTHDYKALVKARTVNKITGEDEIGKVQLNCLWQETYGQHGISFVYHPEIKYVFRDIGELQKARGKLFSCCNLLSFLLNGYIKIDNIYVGEEIYNEYLYIMNYQEELEGKDKPFAISAVKIKDDFNSIWKRWIDFQNDNFCIVELFYEIICNRSTRINKFLNPMQAIEVYSCRLREDNTKNIKNRLKDGTKSIILKHRLIDIIEFINCIFGFTYEEIKALAKKIADARNYYTHYNKARYVVPTFHELITYNKFIQYVLLSLVYRELNIDDSVIDIATICDIQTVKNELKSMLV